MKGIVFLDRDGTLIEDVGYISDPAEMKEIPGAAESLRRLAGEGYVLAVVSNQAGLAKGKLIEEQQKAVHLAFVEYFRSRGVVFDAVEYCPHHPDGTVERYRKSCSCRKPGPGMARRIIRRMALPRSCRAWVIGDKMSDVSMGKRLRAETILVATGYGEKERLEGERRGELPDAFLPSIREAVDWIITRETMK